VSYFARIPAVPRFGITVAEIEDSISIAKLKKRFLAKIRKYIFEGVPGVPGVPTAQTFD
jgi:hypothetical protein